jgi:hypothetical protein
MGYILDQIRLRSRDAGSKTSARRKAEKWFIQSKKNVNEKGVITTTQPFKPGKIYVFKYLNPKFKYELPWYDTNPVVLAIDSDVDHDFGINLNLLPVNAKEQLLDLIYDKASGDISTQTTGRKSGDASKQNPIPLKYDAIKSMLNKYGFDFALRQYIISRRRNQAVIAYENWPDIALCDFASINGDSLTRIKIQFKNNSK